MSPTIIKTSNLRFIIYPHDHLPPHIHIKSNECEAKFCLETFDFIEAYGFSKKSLKQIKDFILERKSFFIENWNEWKK